MLTFLGFAMVIAFMYLIMSKRLTALIALILGVIGWRAVQRPRNRGLLIGILASSLLILAHAAVDVPLNTPSFEAFWALLLGIGFALAQAPGSRR